MERTVLHRLFAALAEHGVRYVLIGGVAVNLHGIVRATEDVDLVVRPDEDNVARLRRALRDTFDDPEVEAISSEDLAGPYPVVRYVPPAGTPVVDIIARLGTTVGFDDVDAEGRTFDGAPLSVATPAALHRLKRATTRPIDAQDAARLATAFELHEED